MFRNLILASVALTMTVPAMAAPCRDAKGKFAKCPTAPTKPIRCKDAKGRFAKCGASGAKPM